jgi:malonyl-CoA O-methyltransferase
MTTGGATSREKDASGSIGNAGSMPSPFHARVDAVALARLADRLQLDDEPWLHAQIGRRMAERLPLFAARPRRAVQWWGPTRGDPSLRAAYPDASIRVTRSEGCLARGAVAHPGGTHQRRPWWQRLAGGSRPQAVAADVLADASVPPSSADLLWANMVLHAVPDAAALLRRWHAALEDEGLAMFSTIGPDTVRELRDLYRAQGWGPPAVEPVDMHDIGDALVQAGFADPVMDQERLTLHWASPQALLAELRTIGANAAADRHAGLRTPRWRQRLHEALQARAVDGRIALTFEVVYGHAFKVRHRGHRAHTQVALDDLAASLPSRRRGREGG